MGKRLEVNTSWCKGCGICVAFCPKKILRLNHGKVEVIDDSACLRSGICENLCPDFAIYLVEEEDPDNG